MITDGKSANSTTLRAQKLRVALRQTLASEFIQETTRKPARCQRSSVSGLIIFKASRTLGASR